jgi:hypothetical protein
VSVENSFNWQKFSSVANLTLNLCGFFYFKGLYDSIVPDAKTFVPLASQSDPSRRTVKTAEITPLITASNVCATELLLFSFSFTDSTSTACDVSSCQTA